MSAAAYVQRGPTNAWGAPSRIGPPGRLASTALARLLRPYAARHGELEVALVETLRGLADRQAQTEKRLAELGRPPAGR